MKVLLVKPNNLSDHIQPSLGLGYLAQGIRSRHDVEIIDCIKDNIAPEEFGRQIASALKPDLVGIQCYTFDLRNVRRILRSIKEMDPRIITVVGGAHMSSDPERAFENLSEHLDFGFAGEAEIGFPQFCDLLESGEDAKDFSSIPGLIWRQEGETVLNDTVMEQDLDKLGYPAWDLIRPERYPEAQHGAFFKKFPIAPIITTRGCPYACTFCSAPILSGKKLRHHSLEYILRNIELLYHTHGIREFHIVDDNFTQDIEYAKKIVRGIISLNLDLSLAMPNGIRMDYLDDELLQLLKQAGLYIVSIAVESGNDTVLKTMKKGTTVKKIRENVERIQRNGLDIAAFFILGFPGETPSTLMDTINLSLELPLVRANYFTYLPLPGTESYRALEASGEIKKVDWDNFYFMSAAYTPRGIDRQELLRLKRMAFMKFHLRPRVLIKNLLAIKNFRHLQFLLRRFYHWILLKDTVSSEFLAAQSKEPAPEPANANLPA
ncbi:MAG: B12-binding domain-containing radical SAM protein [Nitrospinales bacterium]